MTFGFLLTLSIFFFHFPQLFSRSIVRLSKTIGGWRENPKNIEFPFRSFGFCSECVPIKLGNRNEKTARDSSVDPSFRSFGQRRLFFSRKREKKTDGNGLKETAVFLCVWVWSKVQKR